MSAKSFLWWVLGGLFTFFVVKENVSAFPEVAWDEVLTVTLSIVWIAGFLVSLVWGVCLIWITAVRQSGMVKGGTFGLIPATFFGFTAIFVWPIYAGIAWFNKNKLMRLTRTVFDIETKT